MNDKFKEIMSRFYNVRSTFEDLVEIFIELKTIVDGI